MINEFNPEIFSSFCHTEPFEKRKRCSMQITTKYPDRIPVIIEKHKSSRSSNISDLMKKKYLIPSDMLIGRVVLEIRKQLKETLSQGETLCLYINGKIIPLMTNTIGSIYKYYKHHDGFLYLVYSGESTFG